MRSAMTVRPVPEHHNAVCPYLVVEGAAKVVAFLKETFNAEELACMRGPNGRIMHAELRIADSIVMLGEPMGGPPFPGQVHCYVPDVDAAYARALKAGGTSLREPIDMFYGDRISMVKDPTGNVWAISTHKEDVSAEEMERRMAAQMRKG
jgi:PhnB protein